MKAEHRKELQTNALADSMGRLIQGFRSSPKPNTVVVWIIALLAVGTVAAWYFSSRTGDSRSALWARLDGDYNPASLEDIARESKGTLPGRTARFQLARIRLREGLRSIYAVERSDAAKDLEEARKLFNDLATECSDTPLLVQEALTGAAKAEEALVGVPKQDNPDETRGSLDAALKLYQRVAALKPETELTRDAERRAGEIEKNGEQMKNFYAEMFNKGKKPK